MKNINERLNKVYDFTIDFIKENGFPPSVREICLQLNIKSTATAYSYIEKLRNKGLLDKSPQKKRAITPTIKCNYKSLPLVGTVSAGSPILAVENIEGYYPIPEEFSSGSVEFALKVQGDSMIDAGIYDKDIIIVHQTNTAKNGEIVVALIDDSATVKRYFYRNGKVILHPENANYSDMIFNDGVTILGIVKGLLRKF